VNKIAHIAIAFVAVIIMVGCDSMPISPAPIKEQSISVPKETALVKPETMERPASEGKKSATGHAASSSTSSNDSASQNQKKDGSPVSGSKQSSEPLKPNPDKQKEDDLPAAATMPLKEEGEPIQSLPQSQKLNLEEKARSAGDSISTASPDRAQAGLNTEKNISPLGGVNWTWPTDLPIAQPFTEARKGVDFLGTAGQPVRAAANGVASYLGNSLRGYGQMVVIKHDQGFISVYANNSKILVKEGQKIEKGQKIAETGHADGSDLALHFELRQQGKPLDPSSLFPPR
jgi:lipoprotein NlpD